MRLFVDYVPDGGRVEVFVDCPECKGNRRLPSGANCQACGGDGRHTYLVPVNALALYFKSFDQGTNQK